MCVTCLKIFCIVTSQSKKKPVGALLFKNLTLNLESSVILLSIKFIRISPLTILNLGMISHILGI